VNHKRTHQNGVIAAERRRLICELARTRGSVSVASLAEQLGVGRNTVRSDLDLLDQEGILIRSHGGALAKSGAIPRPPYSDTQGTNIDQKSWIGRGALGFVPEYGSLFLGAGSTTHQMVRGMTPGGQLHIVTYSLESAAYLVSNSIASVEFPGGVILPASLVSDCSLSLDLFESVYWDMAFMGAAAIDLDRGITAYSRAGAVIDRKIMENSSRVIMLCDSSKLGRFAYGKVGPVNLMSVLITDTGAAPDFVRELTEQGVEVVLAGPTSAETAAYPLREDGMGHSHMACVAVCHDGSPRRME
jgi:DeoR/GlpR family transcriptional regulator of sugar metabolism